MYCLHLGWVRNARVLFSGGIGNTVLAWNIDTKICLGEMEPVKGSNGGVTKSLMMFGRDVYSVGGDQEGAGEILVWDAETRALLGTVALPKPAMCHVCVGGLLVVGDSVGGLHVLTRSRDVKTFHEMGAKRAEKCVDAKGQ